VSLFSSRRREKSFPRPIRSWLEVHTFRQRWHPQPTFSPSILPRYYRATWRKRALLGAEKSSHSRVIVRFGSRPFRGNILRAEPIRQNCVFPFFFPFIVRPPPLLTPLRPHVRYIPPLKRLRTMHSLAQPASEQAKRARTLPAKMSARDKSPPRSDPFKPSLSERFSNPTFSVGEQLDFHLSTLSPSILHRKRSQMSLLA